MDGAVLTIGQLAAFAGVTVRAVRHYHDRGLLPEPERDASGYRRYDVHAVVDLIRIKVLAEAGVPLSRVEVLLDADPDAFAAAIDEIDCGLLETIRRTQEHRRRVARLVTGDGLALPASVVDYLDLLRDKGLSERIVGIERDGWILIAAHSPDRVEDWIRLKREAFTDEAYRGMYCAFDLAFDWAPGDPRLVELADAMVAYARAMSAAQDSAAPTGAELDDTVIALLDSHAMLASPGWGHLAVLIEQRGLRGWTDLKDVR